MILMLSFSSSSVPPSASALALGATLATESGSSPNPMASLRRAGKSLGLSLGSFRNNQSSSSADGEGTDDQYGQSFTQMLQQNPKYKYVSNVVTDFDVRLVHSTRRGPLHWYVLVHMVGSDLPFLTIEITTFNLTDLIPTMRTIYLDETGRYLSQSPTEVGIYHGTLQNICKFADAVVTEMGGYNLLVSNCQHFCNNLLKKLNSDFHIFDTTIGPQTTLDDEETKVDFITTVLRQFYDKTLAGAPTGIGSIGAAVVGSAVGAPSAIRATLKKQTNNN